MFKGLRQGDYVPYSIQDVDYLPKVKFRRVVKRPYLNDELIESILRAGQTANLINHKAKKYKHLKPSDIALIALERMRNRFGEHSIVDENGLTIYKDIEEVNQGLRHSICFMPDLKAKNIELYWFMCGFIRTCQIVGIGDYTNEYYDFYLDNINENIDSYEDPQMIKMECYSYKYGYPAKTMNDINKAPLLQSNFDKSYGLPLDISAQVRKLVKLSEQGICIQDYELDFESDGYRSLADCNVFSWDDGHIEEDVQHEINDYVNNYGLMKLADFANYNDKHTPFKNKGHLLKEFLELFCNTDIFTYLNGKYQPISAESDGTRIYHRDILGQTELQL
jgi:hypothetical protein